jgi:adenylate cyclase class 2
MKTEIEVKFLNVDHNTVRQKLKNIGAKMTTPMRPMRRVIIDTPEMKSKNAYLRIRDEGTKVTITYKQFNDLSVDGAKEIELTVSNFESVIELLNAVGLPYRSFQETRRETWEINDVEIVLDEWPWLKPYIEIEGNSETEIRNVAEKLGFDWNHDASFGDVMVAYRAEYPHLGPNDTIGDIAEARFGDPLPDFLKA